MPCTTYPGRAEGVLVRASALYRAWVSVGRTMSTDRDRRALGPRGGGSSSSWGDGAGGISSVFPPLLLIKQESTEAARSLFSSGTARKNSLTTTGSGTAAAGGLSSRCSSGDGGSSRFSLSIKASCLSSFGEVIDRLLLEGEGSSSLAEERSVFGERVTVMQHGGGGGASWPSTGGSGSLSMSSSVDVSL